MAAKTASAQKVAPLADRVVVKAMEESEQMRGGLYIPDTAKEKPQEAEVISLGTGGKDEDGKTIEFTVKVGDKVLISKYGGTELNIDGEDVIVLSEHDILAKLDAPKKAAKGKK